MAEPAPGERRGPVAAVLDGGPVKLVGLIVCDARALADVGKVGWQLERASLGLPTVQPQVHVPRCRGMPAP